MGEATYFASWYVNMSKYTIIDFDETKTKMLIIFFISNFIFHTYKYKRFNFEVILIEI